MSAKLIPYSKDSRVLIQQAEATIQSILDAIVELVGETFCRVLAWRKMQEMGGIPGGPETQISNFNSIVDGFQRKHLDKIHEIILNWKFK